MNRTSLPSRFLRSSPPRHGFAATASALVALAVVLLLDAFDLLHGPFALLCVGIVWIALPTARRLSRRVALNGAIGLGIIPLLWWFPWPRGHISHSGVVIGLLLGFIVFRVAWSSTSRRKVLPKASFIDLIPLGVALIAAWFFRPFLKYDSGLGSVSLLRQAFGGDNVAHFDMFEMIRRTLVFGPGWPQPLDGSIYAYVPYPQHFHVLVAFSAELWGGPRVGTVDVETGLFGIGAAIVLSLALVTLVAALCSLRALRKHPGLALIAAAACLSFLLLGFGSTALSYGFPGYLLAIVGTLIAIVLAANGGTTSRVEFFAVAASVVLVAHSWSLLTPLAAVALVFVTVRLPWVDYRQQWRSATSVLIVGSGAVGAVGYAAYLVLAATTTAGSPEAALSTNGAVPTTSLSLTLALGLTIIGASIGLMMHRRRGRSLTRSLDGPFGGLSLLAVAAGIGVVEGVALITIQLQRAGELSYFQYKFANALNLMFSVLLVLVVCWWVARFTKTARGRARRISSAILAAFLAIVVVLFSGLPVVPQPSLHALQLQGLQFRHDLGVQALTVNERTNRLIAASTLMATLPCRRPIYVAPLPDDLQMDEANQWAMSLSATWTEAAQPANSYLFAHNSRKARANVSLMTQELLGEGSGRCVIVAPEVYKQVSTNVLKEYGDRIFTWPPQH